ncbi:MULTISPECIES: hypothetical protein [unclassified Rothia (in: high G+C Gram-positive bacteria)]|uniref:hypothetical protein n=1 Tax=unclassified Rothia (in: high G+C Gram-positive bacteria) TaxID=2689056 RepID=UPI00195B8374|nr:MULTISPECIES: hypothetical protein [unclassified Rothia (in: high G+C Gram-positive bacteria)]MBM7051343.1 hypothetical protein [Rothia sp. ZJ1223]QRZ61138.1 hypothetical protein JR346_07750 [Rothia sp. ZJ932]
MLDAMTDYAHLYADRPETLALLRELEENRTIWLPHYSLTARDNGAEIGVAVAHVAFVRCWVGSFPTLLLAGLAGEEGASMQLLSTLSQRAESDARSTGTPSCLLAHADAVHTPDFFAQLGFKPARYEGIKTEAPIERSHFLVRNLNPDFELAPGTIVYPPEYGFDDDSDIL